MDIIANLKKKVQNFFTKLFNCTICRNTDRYVTLREYLVSSNSELFLIPATGEIVNDRGESLS